jgi:hypothetical protein
MIEFDKVVAIPERKTKFWLDYECRKLATLPVLIKYDDKNKNKRMPQIVSSPHVDKIPRDQK